MSATWLSLANAIHGADARALVARALRFALDYLDVLNSSGEEREVALSSAAGLSVSMLKHLVNTTVKDIEEAVEQERAARAAASSQGSCSVM